MNDDKDVLGLQIAQKTQEIEHYKGVLERYGSGRWMNMGRRHLQALEEELKMLQEQSHNACEKSGGGAADIVAQATPTHQHLPSLSIDSTPHPLSNTHASNPPETASPVSQRKESP